MLFIAQTALELGFAYALVSLALFLSYRILDIADLTTYPVPHQDTRSSGSLPLWQPVQRQDL